MDMPLPGTVEETTAEEFMYGPVSLADDDMLDEATAVESGTIIVSAMNLLGVVGVISLPVVVSPLLIEEAETELDRV